MSITRIPAGRHRAADRIAELEAQLAQTEADNRALIAANETLVCELTRTIIRGCQDAILITELKDQRAGLVAGIRKTQGDLIRAKAEQERLRQAVVAARPRIREVPTDLVRPYSPVVCLPYVSPVPHRDTSGEQTQELPLLDQPAIWPVYPTPAA